eukprot:CAMPEP_0176340130 /NCGR_PEP_ID=MMETSP0126-20121128/1324_1 /TAXON_ID=141414 ORGANISM="Strombidinopsis acuminatum, Strain SPMC142" /NCGR_SAMPLE_ID=MMETSP0126 /ASSEMBLY_ACC=CAM_ASM_000229 /LENGTH=183 /DNA_ID=CAMNT_0017684147 /DNA_START=88 /DNA_END=639 /DNA_ORIENTATION=-
MVTPESTVLSNLLRLKVTNTSTQMVQNTHYAVCVLNQDGNSGVHGIVKFTQVEGQKCRIVAEFTGLTEGKHGFHIHQFGNLIEGCKTAGPHYNPHGVVHGGPVTEVRHVGDLGNVEAGADGVAKLDFEDHMVMIYGEQTVIGRSCVCHAKEDDLGQGGDEESTKTGNAGARVACGVIGLSAAH